MHNVGFCPTTATLPSFQNLPAAFEDCIQLGPNIFLGLTPEERKAGTCHSAQLLHILCQQGGVGWSYLLLKGSNVGWKL